MICFVDISVHLSVIYYRFSYLSDKSASLSLSLCLWSSTCSSSLTEGQLFRLLHWFLWALFLCVSLRLYPSSLTHSPLFVIISSTSSPSLYTSSPLSLCPSQSSLSVSPPLKHAHLPSLSLSRCFSNLNSMKHFSASSISNLLYLSLDVCVAVLRRRKWARVLFGSLHALSSYGFSLYIRKHKLLQTYYLILFNNLSVCLFFPPSFCLTLSPSPPPPHHSLPDAIVDQPDASLAHVAVVMLWLCARLRSSHSSYDSISPSCLSLLAAAACLVAPLSSCRT